METKNSEAVNSGSFFQMFQMCHTLMQPNAKFTGRGSFSITNLFSFPPIFNTADWFSQNQVS